MAPSVLVLLVIVISVFVLVVGAAFYRVYTKRTATGAPDQEDAYGVFRFGPEQLERMREVREINRRHMWEAAMEARAEELQERRRAFRNQHQHRHQHNHNHNHNNTGNRGGTWAGNDVRSRARNMADQTWSIAETRGGVGGGAS